MQFPKISFAKETSEIALESFNNVGVYAPDPKIITQKTISNPARFKGEVQDTEIKFPKELGVEHPFEYEMTEGLYKSVGLIAGAIDKFIDFIWGPGIHVKSDDPKAKKIIDDWLRDVDFDHYGRRWTRMALIDGMGVLELGGKQEEPVKGVKLLDAKTMFMKRDKKGNIEKWTQYLGSLKSFKVDKTNDFSTYQIADLQLNVVGTEAYGLGVVYPSRHSINNLVQSEKDLHLLMKRKANAPIHAKIGSIEHRKMPTTEAVNEFGAKMEWLTNKHEWATDALVDMKVLDFGNIGEKFDTVLKNDIFMTLAGIQMPIVLMGMDNVPEGLATAQLEALQRCVNSYQQEIEKVIERKIFTRVLEGQGIKSNVEIEWGEPSKSELNEKLTKLKEMLSLPELNYGLRRQIEEQIAVLLGLDVKLLSTEEEERKREEEKNKQPGIPGQNNSEESFKDILDSDSIYTNEDVCPHCQELDETKDYELAEWLGFNYRDYKRAIEAETEKYAFAELKAKDTLELSAGRLTDPQVEKLREAMSDGFKNEKTIKEIADDINENVQPKDLLQIKDGEIVLKKNGSPKLITSSALRGIAIARTESTRLANLGAVSQYKAGGVTQYRWISSTGSRTCPTCDALNGRVFKIGEGPLPPDPHGMCRCTTGAITELDQL